MLGEIDPQRFQQPPDRLRTIDGLSDSLNKCRIVHGALKRLPPHVNHWFL
jgi:hypothetical protein